MTTSADKKHKGGYGSVPRMSLTSQSGEELGTQAALAKEADDLGIRTYDSTTGLAIVLNYIIGTGAFGLPMAFYQVCVLRQLR